LRLGGAEVFAWDDSAPAVEKAKAAGFPIANLHMNSTSEHSMRWC
jgi:UDP-N-acetylmuramoylalanine--D-glutamate ligase